MILELDPNYYMKDYPIDIRFIERSTEKCEDDVFLVRKNETEILIVNNGELTVTTQTSSYTIVAGQGITIRNNIPRRISTSEKENTAYYRLVFSPTFVLESDLENQIFAKYYNVYFKKYGKECMILDETNLKDEAIVNTINEIIALNTAKRMMYEIYTKGLLCRLYGALFDKAMNDSENYNGRNVPSRDELRVKSAVEYIKSEYSDMITLDSIADRIHVSRNECCRCFKRVLGTTPVEYLIRIRIYEAARVLYKDPLSVNSIAEIGLNVGFNNISYFNKMFKRYFECTPSEFVAMIKNNPDRATVLFDNMQEMVEGII